MEHTFTPEEVVKTSITTTAEAAAIVLPAVAKVGKAALPATSWALDEVVGAFPGIRRVRPYTTRKWRAAAFYGKEEQHGK